MPLGESAPPHSAIHRIGGYPDERRGDMPLICELQLLGVDLEGKAPATHPLAAALEREAGDWRLLAQLGADDDLGWSWGPRYQRLYVWGQVEDRRQTSTPASRSSSSSERIHAATVKVRGSLG